MKINKLAFRTSLVILSLIVAMVIPIGIFGGAVSADEYDDKIAALEAEIALYQAESERLSQEAVSLQATLNQLAAQKAAVQAELNISQAKFEQLTRQIAETEKRIKDNKDALGVTIANMYVEDDITPLEMLASSKNISEYLDMQEYRSSVRDQLTSVIDEIKQLKTSLEGQKTEIAKVIADQEQQRGALAAKEAAQQALLSQTRGDEATYQSLIGSNMDAINEARAIQAALRNKSNSTGGYKVLQGGLALDYITDSRFGIWSDYNCPMGGYIYGQWVSFASNAGVDGNGSDGRGYGCRQCASYVAWRIFKETGNYYSWGNANNFDNYARSIYGAGDNQPRAGAIAVMDAGTYGHVAWVETDPYVNEKGQTVIQVSQYNFDYGQGYGMYSLMELSVGFFDYYIQIVE